MTGVRHGDAVRRNGPAAVMQYLRLFKQGG